MKKSKSTIRKQSLIAILILAVMLTFSIPMSVFAAGGKPTRDLSKDVKWISTNQLEICFESDIQVTNDAVSKIKSADYSGTEEVDIAQSVKADGKKLIVTVKDEYKTIPMGVLIIQSGAVEDASSNVVNDEISIYSNGIKSGASVTGVSFDKTSLSADGGTITATLTGSLLSKEESGTYALKPTSDGSGYYAIEGDYKATDDEHATVKFNIGKNEKDQDVTFRLVYKESTNSQYRELSGADTTITIAAGTGKEEPDTPSSDTLSVTKITYDQEKLSSNGGDITVSIEGSGLDKLTTDNFQIEKKGQYGFVEDISATYSYQSKSSSKGEVVISLPENTSASDEEYRLNYRLQDEDDWINGKKLAVSANAENVPQITKISAPKSNLTSAGGTVTIGLEGTNLKKLNASDIVLEEKGSYGGYMIFYDGQVTIQANSDSSAQLSFTLPNNTGSSVKDYRVKIGRAAADVDNSVLNYSVPAPSSGKSTFTVDVDDINAYKLSDDTFEITFPNYDRIAVNSELDNYKNSIVFGNGYDSSSDYVVGEKDIVNINGNTISIHIADTSKLKSSGIITFKKGVLENSKGEILGQDVKTYIHDSAHAESISYNKTTLTSTGGEITAVLKGTNLNASNPALYVKVFTGDEKDASTALSPVINVNAAGTEATIKITLPENKTNSPISYRLIPYLNGSSVYSVYLKGYDVITVLGQGQKDDGIPKLSAVEISGGNDVDNRPDVYETTVTSADYTLKIDAVLRGTDLSSRKTKVKVVDENGIEWPISPVYECGATVRWQSSANYLPEDASKNEQSIELLPPRHIGADKTYRLYFAVDGEHFADTPYATVIIHNDNVWSQEDGFMFEELNQLQNINVKYVDEQGQSIHAPKTLKGYGITELYTLDAAPIDIEGYTLKKCNIDQHWFEAPVLKEDGAYHFTYGQHFVRDLKGKDIVYTYTKNANANTNPSPVIPGNHENHGESVVLNKMLVKKSVYVYTGKNIVPKIIVMDADNDIVDPSLYEVSGAAKSVGRHTVTVKFKNGTGNILSADYVIRPAAVKGFSVKAGKKSAKAVWKSHKAQTSGFQIQYGTSKNLKHKKTITVRKASAVQKTIQSLKSKKAYFFRIRAYKTIASGSVSDTTYYSAWSSVKGVHVK